MLCILCFLGFFRQYVVKFFFRVPTCFRKASGSNASAPSQGTTVGTAGISETPQGRGDTQGTESGPLSVFSSPRDFACSIICHSVGFFVLFYFLNFWLRWVFVAAHGLSLVAVSGRGHPSLWCVGFSLRWLLLLQSTGPRACGLQ